MTGVAEIFVGLLLAVAVLALVARKLHIPYPILFVIGGLLLGLIPELPKVRLDPELVFLFCPAAAAVSGGAVHLVARFPGEPPSHLAARHRPRPVHHGRGRLSRALFHGPAARRRICFGRHHFSARRHRRHGDCRTAAKFPRRIVTILEGESLVNDATALVAYRFAVVAVATGSFSLAHASGQFFIVGIGGILIGLAVGWLAEQFHKRVDDAPIEITVSLLTPFVAYLSAERLGVSGVLAVVTAGLYLGWRMPELLTLQDPAAGRAGLGNGGISAERFRLHPHRTATARSAARVVRQCHSHSPARLVCAAHQPRGDSHSHPVGFPGDLSAAPALQKTLRQRSVSDVAARHHRRVDGHARGGFARGGPGAAAHDAKTARRFRAAI